MITSSSGRPTELATRVAIIFGTRPEAIKLAPVVRAFSPCGPVAPMLINTGQHRELLDPLMKRLRLTADVDLDVMRDQQSLPDLTAKLVEGLGHILRKHHPKAAVVQGDTTTALCGALAAFYEHIPVAHVEAGLRSGTVNDPFPEELNRRLISLIARWHFAPTPGAAAALRAEGYPADRIDVTGNTVIDSLLWVLEQGNGQSAFTTSAHDTRRILVTLHRRENQGAKMRGMAEVLRRLADRGDVEILLPLHRSPATRDTLISALAGHPAITLVEALEYPDFTATLAACDLILTDSGGVQEEAPSLGKPVLVLRATTERPEAITAGSAVLVGTDPDTIHTAATTLLDDPAAYVRMANATNPFGDGQAANRIVQRLVADLQAGR